MMHYNHGVGGGGGVGGGFDPLEDSMDAMESLMLHPADVSSYAYTSASPAASGMIDSAEFGSATSASQSYMSHAGAANMDPLAPTSGPTSAADMAAADALFEIGDETEPLYGNGGGSGLVPPPPPSYTDALQAPRVSATSSSSSSPRPTGPGAGASGAAGGSSSVHAGPSYVWHEGVPATPSAGSSGSGSSSMSGFGGSSSNSSGEFIEIKVGDPQKHPDPYSSSMLPGGGAYVTYAVYTKTNIAEFCNLPRGGGGGGGGESGAGEGASGADGDGPVMVASFKVRRRFKEFVALADRLAESHRGHFVPTRPDKSVVENQLMAGKDFVEMRRVELEKYLQRLARHPAIQRSHELLLFLTAEGKLPMFPSTDVASRMLEGAVKLPGQLLGSSDAASVPTPADAVKPASGGRDLLRLFKELKQSVTNEWVGTGSAAAAPVAGTGAAAAGNGGGAAAATAAAAAAAAAAEAEAERQFAVRRAKLAALEKHLSEASVQAENLLCCERDAQRALGGLGLTVMGLSNLALRGRVEGALGAAAWSPSTAASVQYLGNVCHDGATKMLKQSRVMDAAGRESLQQLSQLHEYLKTLLAARSAFADRAQAHVTVQTLAADVVAKEAKLDRLNSQPPRVGGDPARVKKAFELQRDVELAQKSLAAAEGEYARIKERNAEELDRFECERRADMSSMLTNFAHVQALKNERTIQLWQQPDAVARDKGKALA